jgi:hypothetical protein
MNPRRSAAIVLVALLILVYFFWRTGPVSSGSLHAVLSSVERCTSAELAKLKDGGANGVVLALDSSEDAFKVRAREAAELTRAHDLGLYYWIEIARDESLAEAHSDLLAGLDGHDNWRTADPDAPVAGMGERLGAWPWVSILHAAAFELQLAKVEQRLAGLPAPDGLFLNDLQGGPSACGCGNRSCRWTTDYLAEPSTPLSQAPVAERFLSRVRALHAGTRIVPVWTTECGIQGDRAGDACHGVPCATGNCWPALVEELRPLVRAGNSIGVLLEENTPVDFPDRPERMTAEEVAELRYAPVVEGLRAFPAEVAKYGLELSSKRLIPILRAWDSPGLEIIRAQTELAARLGAHEWIVAVIPIDQSWEPRVIAAAGR